MESNMTADEVDTHLSELWRQAAQDVAVQMVRVSIQKDISLEALRRALDHAAKHADLTQVHMRDVMAAKAATAPAQAGAAGQAAPKAANPPRSPPQARNHCGHPQRAPRQPAKRPQRFDHSRVG